MIHSFVKPLGFLAMAAALSLAACNGSNNAGNPSNYPNCTAPGNFVAVYPINGATKVPDNTQTIYVASSVPLGSQYQNVIGAPSGAIYAGAGFTQVSLAQVPKPRTKPSFANPIYYSSYVGTLAPSSTWTMLLNNTNSANCIPVQYQQFTTF
jgi:hypothetical protein